MKKPYIKQIAALLCLFMLFLTVPFGTAAENAEVMWVFGSKEAAEKLETTEVLNEYLRGDLDESGGISGTDVNLLKRHVTGSLNGDLAPHAHITGDLNGDGKVNALDVNLIRRVLTGVIASDVYYDLGDTTAEFDRTLDSACLTVDRPVSNGIEASVAISGTDAKYAVITYMIPTGENGNSDKSIAGRIGTEIIDYTADGYYHSIIAEISLGTAEKLSFEYFATAEKGDRLFIDSVALCKTLEGARAVAGEREAAKAGFYCNGLGVSGVSPLSYADAFGGKVVRFNSAQKVENYVSLYNNTDFSYDENENALKCTATGVTDPGVYIDLSDENINAGDFNRLVVIFKLPTNVKYRVPRQKIYFLCNGVTEADSACALSPSGLAKNDSYNYKAYTVGSISGLTGQVTGLRLDYLETASSGDTCYIDSIIFTNTDGNEPVEPLTFSYQHILREKNGEGALHVSVPWIEYWAWHSNANDYEYVSGSGENIEMSFKYSSLDALTSESLGSRMARAVSEATGYNVNCTVYGGVGALRDNWDMTRPCGKIYYNFEFEGTTYIVYIKTNIIKDADFQDSLDGNPTQTDPTYDTSTNWSADGIRVSDATALPVSHSSMAAHSNHETRLVETPSGTFAVIPMKDNGTSWGQLGVSNSVFKIEDDGSFRSIYTFESANHSSKPNIFYAADGLVYVLVGDAVGYDYVSAFVAYFDPAKPNADGTYSVSSSRTNIYTGAVSGGWGYTQPILNDTLGIFTLMCCGGSDSGYFAWANYDYENHKWLSGSYVMELETYRHCYLYGFSDGGEGMYVVAGRDVLLSTLGLNGIVYGANYAWDEVNLFHFPSVTDESYKRYTVSEADYTQMYANLFPVTSNNVHGDTYISKDGYMHVLTSTCMHGNYHHDVKYWEMWYTVYDVREAGAEPKIVYHKPISFGNSENEYVGRMIEGSDGRLYYVAMQSGTNVCEIWRQKEDSYEFEIVANKIFEGSKGVTTALIVTNGRNGSVNDDTISVMYPTDDGGGVTYRFFTVSLGD